MFVGVSFKSNFGKITENMRMVDDFCINITMPLHVSFHKKKSGSYSSVDSDSKTVQSTRINHIHTFTVQSTGTYRIKVVIKYKKDGTTYSNTYYQKLKASDELESEL